VGGACTSPRDRRPVATLKGGARSTIHRRRRARCTCPRGADRRSQHRRVAVGCARTFCSLWPEPQPERAQACFIDRRDVQWRSLIGPRLDYRVALAPWSPCVERELAKTTAPIGASSGSITVPTASVRLNPFESVDACRGRGRQELVRSERRVADGGELRVGRPEEARSRTGLSPRQGGSRARDHVSDRSLAEVPGVVSRVARRRRLGTERGTGRRDRRRGRGETGAAGACQKG
jgi:hypothetical protein